MLDGMMIEEDLDTQAMNGWTLARGQLLGDLSKVTASEKLNGLMAFEQMEGRTTGGK